MTSHTPAFPRISLWSYGTQERQFELDATASESRHSKLQLQLDKTRIEKELLAWVPDWNVTTLRPPIFVAEYDFSTDTFGGYWMTDEEQEERWGYLRQETLPPVATYVYDPAPPLATSDSGDHRKAIVRITQAVAHRLAQRLRVPPHTTQDREDFQQDAVLAMLVRMDQYQPSRGSLEQFVQRCLSNLLIDRLRFLMRRREKEELSPQLELASDEDPVFETVTGSMMLAEVQSHAVLALAADGLDDREIADKVDSTYAAARQQRLRAARAFRRRWSL